MGGKPLFLYLSHLHVFLGRRLHQRWQGWWAIAVRGMSFYFGTGGLGVNAFNPQVVLYVPFTRCVQPADISALICRPT